VNADRHHLSDLAVVDDQAWGSVSQAAVANTALALDNGLKGSVDAISGWIGTHSRAKLRTDRLDQRARRGNGLDLRQIEDRVAVAFRHDLEGMDAHIAATDCTCACVITCKQTNFAVAGLSVCATRS